MVGTTVGYGTGFKILIQHLTGHEKNPWMWKSLLILGKFDFLSVNDLFLKYNHGKNEQIKYC